MSDALDIDKQLASINKGIDKKNDALLLMTPDYNWAQFLQPAPYVIAILGQLLLLSTGTDFSLKDNPPEKGFKHLNRPNSFRTCLVQVANQGWSCFNLAHKNMNQIQLYCDNVNDHVRKSVKYLLHGSPDEVKLGLPLSLNKIEKIANECYSLANQTESGFVDMMDLIAELLEASTSKKGATEDQNRKTKQAIKVAEMQRKLLESEVKDSKERLERLEQEIREAQTEFKDAMDSIPSGGDLLGLVAAEAGVNALRNVLQVGLDLGSKKLASSAGVAPSSNPGVTQPSMPAGSSYPSTMDQQFSIQRVSIQIERLHSFVAPLYDLTTRQPKPDWRRVKTEAEYLKQTFQTISSNIDRQAYGSGNFGRRAKDLCDECINVCRELLKNAENLSPQNEDYIVKNLVSRVEDIQRQERLLDTEARRQIGSNPLDTKSPHLSQMPPSSEGDSIVEKTIANARFKTEVAKETLKDAKRREEKSHDELRKSNEALTKVLVNMEQLKIDETDFETIRNTLIEGINALSELKNQWGKLVRFFQMLTNITKCCLSETLTDFVSETKIGRQLKIEGKSLSVANVIRDGIVQQAAKCSQISFIVYTVSKSYVDISDKHLMEKITALSSLIALDPETQKAQIQQAKMKLNQDCSAAQEDIADLVEENKAQFMDQIGCRIKQIQNLEEQWKKQYPEVKEEKIKEIKETVSKAFESENDDHYTDKTVDDEV